jgi:hypothetical protein
MTTAATFTIEVVLRQNGDVIGTRQPVEWVGLNNRAARQTAYDILLQSSKLVASRYDLFDEEGADHV